jgi:pseudouridine-5'-monophosphatase
MDGLMFNTEDLYDRVGEILLQRRGQRFSRELKLMMMGRPGPSAFDIMIGECNLDDSAESLQKEADQIFQDMLPAEIKTMPGLEKLLDTLDQRKIPKAVATSSHRKFAQRALGFFDLEPRFEFVLTCEDVVNGKPHPEIYLTAARRLDVLPDQMLVLEDSLFGTQAAIAAGAFTIAVPTVHSHGVDFGHVDHVATTLADPAIFKLFGQD